MAEAEGPERHESVSLDALERKRENTVRIQSVEKRFGTNGAPLVTKDRVMIGEGVLTKVCRKALQPRQLFLFNDILVREMANTVLLLFVLLCRRRC